MNTKRLFFGLLAVAFLAMTAVSTDVINIDEDQTVSVDKKKIGHM
ncbi:hypothetical protein [Flagellimonas hymeniacidonis]|nr:hypothetical protein [Flagellimonas hymeniacidonis]